MGYKGGDIENILVSCEEMATHQKQPKEGRKFNRPSNISPEGNKFNKLCDEVAKHSNPSEIKVKSCPLCKDCEKWCWDGEEMKNEMCAVRSPPPPMTNSKQTQMKNSKHRIMWNHALCRIMWDHGLQRMNIQHVMCVDMCMRLVRKCG